MRRKLRGFTLAELLIGMVLFSLVMAVSGAAVSVTMTLLGRETDRTLSSGYGSRICGFLSDEIRYACSVDITTSLYSPDGYYDRYDVSGGDLVLYIADGAIYSADSVSGGSVMSKTELFESEDTDMYLKCRPDVKSETVTFELTLTKSGDKDNAVLKKTAAARRMNGHIGSFRAQGNIDEFTSGYYICIDRDGR